MTYDELIQMLTDGLPADEAAAVTKAVNRDTVKTRAAALRQQSELDALQARATALNAELEGGPDKPGAKAYAKWYADNFAAVQKLQADNAKFVEKYGTLEAPKVPANPEHVLAGLSKEDVQREIDSRFNSNFAPNIADVLKKTGTLVQKHMYAKRTNPIDFDAIDKIMGEKKIPLEAAYDEWDRPEREKDQKAATEAEISRRVTEEMQKRGSAQVSGGTDYSSRVPSPLLGRGAKDFKPENFMDSLAQTFVDAGREKTN
jgi:hypothetical protein